MKTAVSGARGSHGFTLIEIIVTLIIGSILSALIVPYLGKALTASSVPIFRLSSAMDLKTVIENITEDYRQVPTDLGRLETSIGAEGSSQNNAYGQYQVILNHFIKFVSYNDEPRFGSDPANLLKVTIASNDTGETMTALFVEE
jgi:prepilin-type N-terminal cleavage/methylation domain-containing protein